MITGASRGIGLALVDACAARGLEVVATCRKPDEAGSLMERTLDPKIRVARRTAGLAPFDRGFWEEAMVTNVIGAMHLSALMIPALRRGAGRRIVAISSALGSIAGTTGGTNAYRSSKAALNMGMRTLAEELRPERFTVVSVSPGVVDTELARDVPGAKISPGESAEALMAFLGGAGPDDSGRFYRHTGEELAW